MNNCAGRRSAAAPVALSTSERVDPGRDVALALFLAWLVLVVSGFWLLLAMPTRAALAAASEPQRIEVFERWLASEQLSTAAERVVVVDPSRDCHCDDTEAVELAAFVKRATSMGIRVIERAWVATPLPAHARIAVFGAEGRLRYAGPLRVPMFCSGMTTLADAALREINASAPAMVFGSNCVCEATDRRSVAFGFH